MPCLTGVIEAPLLLPTGEIIQQNGYHKPSGLYLHYTGGPLSIPEHPTLDNAKAALNVLKDPFSEFTYGEESPEVYRSVAIAGLLTTIQRRILRTAPFTAIDAPDRGAGKGLTVDTISRIATGVPASALTAGDSEAETEKRVGSAILKGCAVVSVDNIEGDFNNSFLNMLATQEVIEVRILGTINSVILPTSSTAVFMTGNNFTPCGDITRRLLVCRIDPQCERPDARTFNRNLHTWVPENRERLLSAALTLLKAYHDAGRPKHGRAPYGSFEQWDDLIRGALLWAGCADPLDSRQQLDANDPDREALRALIGAWAATYGQQFVTLSDIKNAVADGPYGEPTALELRQALEPIAFERGMLNTRRLGKYLRRNKGKVIGGLRIYSGSKQHQAITWAVRK